jgi:hypothetical protein
MLDRFDEDEFLKSLEKIDAPPLLEDTKWRSLYKAFLRSPNFWPWFNRRKAEVLNQWSEIHRILRLNISNANLIMFHEDESSKVGLYLRIKKAITVYEAAASVKDPTMITASAAAAEDTSEVFEKMKEHLEFVASKLSINSKKSLGLLPLSMPPAGRRPSSKSL